MQELTREIRNVRQYPHYSHGRISAGIDARVTN